MDKFTTFLSKLKWGFNELVKMYSAEKSFFSKKRIESGIAFIFGQFGMMYFLFNKIGVMTTTDIVMWSAVEFSIAGWMVHQIQKENK